MVVPEDVHRGRWTLETGFVDEAAPYNAVAVTTRRAESNQNPVSLIFAPFLGRATADVGATSVAVYEGGGEVVETQFLIDAEMFDQDIGAIEQLANSLDMDPEEMITAEDKCGTWQDWFIRIPPGSVLRLPTGQDTDEGVFDINHPEFEYQPGAEPYSLEDFLNFNEDSSCFFRYNALGPEGKDRLDPLLGPMPVTDEDWYYEQYGEYGTETAKPTNCMVSPLFKSDVNELDPVDGVPAVNALGERRGLVAFKILGADDGVYLPDLWIEICDPEAILGEGGLSEIGFGDERYRLVG